MSEGQMRRKINNLLIPSTSGHNNSYEKSNRGGIHLDLADSSVTWIDALVQPHWIIVKHLVGTNQIASRWGLVGIKSTHSQRRDGEANKEEESITSSRRHGTSAGRAPSAEQLADSMSSSSWTTAATTVGRGTEVPRPCHSSMLPSPSSPAPAAPWRASSSVSSPADSVEKIEGARVGVGRRPVLAAQRIGGDSRPGIGGEMGGR
jgi:hypothetical protein